MSIVNNERTKLLANALDRASTACFTVGIATPVAGYLYNVDNIDNTISHGRLLLGLIGWLMASAALHYLGTRVLKGLR
ncbi:hypothetical protein [Mesorhizobium sp. RMAD-H1]|uniref:hypothetical protein n=1 Tax=Mesorhizobium sp. RMAD-H1 TaxID=2587065 RepID=UPI001609EB24|nr:hypothetical protein [Mesorhizobium sp. RMAD-H1]MBB2974392.1 hypothetical protein [Mesorhizobium sp. RMAD-H1]